MGSSAAAYFRDWFPCPPSNTPSAIGFGGNRTRGAPFLPDPGETLTATTKDGTTGAIEFIAIDSGDIVFTENGQAKSSAGS